MELSHVGSAKTFVLVHGASHGGWCYDRVAKLLRAKGHRVFAPTLPGLAERLGENAGRKIDLTAHVDDILGLFDREGIEDAFLCGHSYGGMVISGVADRIPDRIRNLVFIDAVVPEDGARMTDYVFPGFKLWPIVAAVWLLGKGSTLMAPPAKFFAINEADRAMVDRQLTPHPMASLREKICLAGNADRIPGHTYIYATEWGFAPITTQFQRAKERAGWKVFEVKSGHDIMIDAPQELAGILSSLD
jgi:pimeloyl-ACP methyl ester carboxylesterase